MANIITKMIENGNLINIVSCVFTVLALVFTVYLWLLDHLSEDEAKYIKEKPILLRALKECQDILENSDSLEKTLEAIYDINRRMEVILNYRFWIRSKQKEEYDKIIEYHRDCRYMISTIQRSMETDETDSLLRIKPLDKPKLEELLSDYRGELSYIIELVQDYK